MIIGRLIVFSIVLALSIRLDRTYVDDDVGGFGDVPLVITDTSTIFSQSWVIDAVVSVDMDDSSMDVDREDSSRNDSGSFEVSFVRSLLVLCDEMHRADASLAVR